MILKHLRFEFTVYYTSTANNLTTLKVARAVFDPSSRASTNHFTAASSGTCTIGDDDFQFYTTSNIDLLSLGITGWATPGVLQYATAKILYNDTVAHKVGIDVSSTGSTLPSQGVKIESNGSYGDANRSIEVYQLHPIAPSILKMQFLVQVE